MKIYPLTAVRALILHTHGLSTPNGEEPPTTTENVYDLIQRIGCVQIDALQMVQRSHYMLLWSRLGDYDTAVLDQLIYGPDRKCFEYWYHAACILPLTEYPAMRAFMDHVSQNHGKRTKKWLALPENREVLALVRQRVQNEGGLRAADFKVKKRTKGAWWNWKPAKQALELCFNWGEMMIADRAKFQRIYDLTERVLPDWVETEPLTLPQARRHVLETAVRVFGLCEPDGVGDFAHFRKRTSRPIIKEMIADGVCLPIEAELATGETETMLVHRDNFPLLEQAEAGELPASRTTFLNPFDNFWYNRQRSQKVWNFRQVLEAYKPKGQYEWGYFSLPILYQDRLIGRFDPKVERKKRRLRLKSIHLEPGVAVDEQMITAVAQTMRDFMTFNGADDLVIDEDKTAVNLGQRLLQAIT